MKEEKNKNIQESPNNLESYNVYNWKIRQGKRNRAQEMFEVTLAENFPKLRQRLKHIPRKLKWHRKIQRTYP